jgi:HK97 gp10 family phage protein
MSMTLTGDKVIERRLKKLPAKVQRNLARKSLRKAMALLRKDARATVVVKTAQLKKAIKSKVSIRANGNMTGRVFVKYKGKGAAPYAHLVEWGGENNTSTRFMTRVFEANKEKVIKEFRNQLIASIALVGKL